MPPRNTHKRLAEYRGVGRVRDPDGLPDVRVQYDLVLTDDELRAPDLNGVVRGIDVHISANDRPVLLLMDAHRKQVLVNIGDNGRISAGGSLEDQPKSD